MRRATLDYVGQSGRLRDYSGYNATRRFQFSPRRPAMAPQQNDHVRTAPVRKSGAFMARLESDVKVIARKPSIQKPPTKTRSSSSNVLRRQFPVPHIKVEKKNKHLKSVQNKYKLRSTLFTIMTCALFFGGIYASWHTYITNKHVVAQVQSAQTDNTLAPSGLSDDGIPDETEVSEGSYGQYHVAPSMPRYITIDSLSVQARVRRMALTKEGAVQAPASIYDAGWHEGSARPGDASGAALIVGHVYGPTKPAVFSKLHSLRSGDIITIERGDGLLVRYSVVASEVYDRESTDMSKALRSQDSTKPGLNIITCHGKYDRASNTYSQRLVVYAVAL